MWREWIVMVTQAIQLSLVLLALLLSAWLGESSPSWRQMPSITHIQTECVLPVCGGWQCGSVRVNARHHCPVCSSSLVPSMFPVCLQEFDLLLSNPRLWKNLVIYLDLSLLLSLLFPPSLPMAVIFIPLSSRSNNRSGSVPISISKGPQQGIGKVNAAIRSLIWTISG